MFVGTTLHFRYIKHKPTSWKWSGNPFLYLYTFMFMCVCVHMYTKSVCVCVCLLMWTGTHIYIVSMHRHVQLYNQIGKVNSKHCIQLAMRWGKQCVQTILVSIERKPGLSKQDEKFSIGTCMYIHVQIHAHVHLHNYRNSGYFHV